MRKLALLISSIALAGAPVWATSIGVDFKNAETPPSSTKVSLPFLLDNTNDTVFLRFKIPAIDTVGTINLFNIQVNLYDDGDRGGETGIIQFALPSGPNLTLTTFGPDLNGFTAGAPDNFSFSLTPSQIAQVFPSIQDGNFRIRIQRSSGDFIVGGGSASIDATVVPEPATWSMLGIGLLLVAAGGRRRFPKLQR